MNSETGHLVDTQTMTPALRARLAEQAYLPIPPELNAAAIAQLDGMAETHVRMRGDGPLSDYRRAQRRRIVRAEQKAAKRVGKR